MLICKWFYFKQYIKNNWPHNEIKSLLIDLFHFLFNFDSSSSVKSGAGGDSQIVIVYKLVRWDCFLIVLYSLMRESI